MFCRVDCFLINTVKRSGMIVPGVDCVFHKYRFETDSIKKKKEERNACVCGRISDRAGASFDEFNCSVIVRNGSVCAQRMSCCVCSNTNYVAMAFHIHFRKQAFYLRVYRRRQSIV